MVVNRHVLDFIRISLGVTFLWFGVLKLFNVSPVLLLIQQAIPPMLSQSQLFLFSISMLEILIGIGFLVNRYIKIVVLIMTAHLLVASFSVLFTQGFDPRFPILSLPGEFVVKNVILIGAGWALFTAESLAKEEDSKKSK